MDEVLLISSMATLMILASLLSIVMNKIKFPPLIGFLAAGILIANFLDLSETGKQVMEILSALGLIMLMFSIGMEIDVSKLKDQGKFAIIVACVQLPLMVLGGILAGTLMGFNFIQCICLGCIISGSSTAVVLAVLNSQGKLTKSHIETLVLITIMEDIGQVIMLSMLTPVLSGSEMSTDSLIVLIIQIAIFMIACFTIGLKFVPRVINWFYKKSNDELISLLCIGALFTLSWAATKMGLSVAIGAFLMGVMVGTSRPKDAVEHFVDPLKSLFMAMFFISVGMEVTISGLTENIFTILAIYLVFFLFKTVTVYLGYWVGNGEARTGFISAMALCAMGEFAFIIAKEALDFGVVDQAFYSSVIGAALVSMIMLPIATKYSDRMFDGMVSKSPAFLKRFFGFMNKIRDETYVVLGGLSSSTVKMFNKGMANVYFTAVLIAFLQIMFYFIYDPLSAWLLHNFGSDEFTWRMAILITNFIIQLALCIRLVYNIRLILHIINLGKRAESIAIGDDDAVQFYESMNPYLIGGSLAIILIIITPNGIDTMLHILVFAVVLLIMSAYQIWKIKTNRKGPALPNIEDH